MQYGEKQTITQDGDAEVESTTKYRHGLPFVEEEVYKERVEIMRPSDLDDIIIQMHIDHALDGIYGAWIEKAANGSRLYAVKYWVKRLK